MSCTYLPARLLPTKGVAKSKISEKLKCPLPLDMKFEVKSVKRWITYIQIIAAIGLGVSFFLPFYKSAVGEIRYVDEWGLFVWPIPVLFILYKLSNRWLKAAFCLLAIIGGLYDLFMLTFLATYKSTGHTGYDIAKASLLILVVSWLILGVVSLFAPRHAQA